MSNGLSLVVLALFAFVIPLAELLCGVVCAVFMRLSKGLLVAAGGFMGAAFFSFINGFIPHLMVKAEVASYSVVQTIHIGLYLVISLMFLVAAGGLAMAFSEIQRQPRRREAFEDSRDRLQPATAREPFQPHAEGSHDIQH